MENHPPMRRVSHKFKFSDCHTSAVHFFNKVCNIVAIFDIFIMTIFIKYCFHKISEYVAKIFHFHPSDISH
jgi:sugar phosphate isomerase/epimerase